METGYIGTFVIPWSSTWIDGQRNSPDTALEPGASWAWHGPPIRLDGPNSVLRLGTPQGGRRRMSAPNPFPEDDALRGGFVVTDGLQTYEIAQIETRPGLPSLLLFQTTIPPRDRRLWVIDRTYTEPSKPSLDQGGVDTRATVRTARGEKRVGALRAGDLIETLHGMQPVVWTYKYQIGPAQLQISPGTRPMRRVEDDLCLAPDHGVLVTGDRITAAYGVECALASVLDLPRRFGFRRELAVDQFQLCHILLPQPSAFRAGDLWLESYVPDTANLGLHRARDRKRIAQACRRVERAQNPQADLPLRRLTQAEAAIALHQVA